MKKSMEKVREEIIQIENMSLKVYYEYIKKYGYDFIFKIFNDILINSEDKEKVLNNYFNVYFSIELDDMVIEDVTYVLLVNKYGEEKVNNYFKELLEVSDKKDKVKEKYEKIYFYIEAINSSRTDSFDDINMVNCDDIVTIYLKEMCRYDLLTVSEEKELLKRLFETRNGIEIAETDDNDNIIIKNINDIIESVKTREQFDKLKKIVDKIDDNSSVILKSYIDVMRKYFRTNGRIDDLGKTIYSEEYLNKQLDNMIEFVNTKERLINCNLRLVVSIAKHYVGRGIDMADLISEGNLGLMRAIRRFDYTKNTRVSTYATWWIRQMVNRYVSDNMRTIRIPVHLGEKMNRYNQAVKRLEQEFGVEPTDEVLSDYLGYSVEEINYIKNVIHSNNYVSLDGYISSEEDTSLLEFVADDSNVEEDYYKLELSKVIDEALSTLTDKEAAVIRYRFGFVDGRKHTLEEVGGIYGVTRERIRQIENKAVRKLRHSSRARKLIDYVN